MLTGSAPNAENYAIVYCNLLKMFSRNYSYYCNSLSFTGYKRVFSLYLGTHVELPTSNAYNCELLYPGYPRRPTPQREKERPHWRVICSRCSCFVTPSSELQNSELTSLVSHARKEKEPDEEATPITNMSPERTLFNAFPTHPKKWSSNVSCNMFWESSLVLKSLQQPPWGGHIPCGDGVGGTGTCCVLSPSWAWSTDMGAYGLVIWLI